VQRKRGANHIAGTDGSAGSGGWEWGRRATWGGSHLHFFVMPDALLPHHDALSTQLLSHARFGAHFACATGKVDGHQVTCTYFMGGGRLPLLQFPIVCILQPSL